MTAAVCVPEGGARVRNALGGTVRGHKWLCFTEMGSRHGGEQVMFDLVVQPAHEDRHQGPAADVAAHQDLAAQEVQLQLGRHKRHADVVGRER